MKKNKKLFKFNTKQTKDKNRHKNDLLETTKLLLTYYDNRFKIVTARDFFKNKKLKEGLLHWEPIVTFETADDIIIKIVQNKSL